MTNPVPDVALPPIVVYICNETFNGMPSGEQGKHLARCSSKCPLKTFPRNQHEESGYGFNIYCPKANVYPVG
jgi:hypothetical protein